MTPETFFNGTINEDQYINAATQMIGKKVFSKYCGTGIVLKSKAIRENWDGYMLYIKFENKNIWVEHTDVVFTLSYSATEGFNHIMSFF